MHRVWSETVPYPELRAEAVLTLLRTYGVFPIVAVRPDDLSGLPDLLSSFADAEVALGLWPMLSDTDGRWFNRTNARLFRPFVTELLDVASKVRSHRSNDGRTIAEEVAFDLEPPFEELKALLSRRPTVRKERGDLSDTRRHLEEMIAATHQRGMRASCAVLPPIALPNGAAWEKRIGTPVRGLAWDHVSVMMYTSMVEGWSLGTLRRAHALEALGAIARSAKETFGGKGGVSLGAVGTGAFGNEPVYRDVHELEEDLCLVRKHELTTTLFDLGGVLRRAPPSVWLEAFAKSSHAGTHDDLSVSKRVRWLLAGLRRMP